MHLMAFSTAVFTFSNKFNNVTNCSICIETTKPRAKMVALPEEYPGIVRVHELTVLGVILTENFSMASHVNKICTRASQSIYALRLLRSHGLASQRLFDVVSSTTLARLTYAMPAWIGYINEEQKG